VFFDTNKRLALIISSLSAGGAERMITEMANSWADRGHKVAMITIAGAIQDHYPLRPSVQRIALDLLRDSHSLLESIYSNLIRSHRTRNAVRDFAPDVVISFMEQTNISVLAALLGTGTPVIISERTDPRHHRVGRIWHLFRRALYPLADALVVQTDAVRSWAESIVAIRKIRVIPNLVRGFSALDVPLLAETSHSRKTLIAMGRLIPAKGFDLLLEAFARSGGVNLGWRLLILGEGPERGNLEVLTKERGLEGYVQLPGVVLEPAHWLRQADLFVLSSRYEGFPNALLEAMACGLPVIAFDCESGPAEIIRHEVDGLLVPPENVTVLAETLQRLMQDEMERRRLAIHALEVEQRFSQAAIMDRWEELIDAVLAQRLRK
jgi:glycosyltransferase involved in cell wall biosynthesis